MESPDPQSTEWIAGNPPLFSRSPQPEHKWNKTRTQLEHKWNTHPRSGTQREHLLQKCKWNTTGTQLGLVHASHVTTPFADEFLQNGIPRPPVYRMDCWKSTAIFQEPPTGTHRYAHTGVCREHQVFTECEVQGHLFATKCCL